MLWQTGLNCHSLELGKIDSNRFARPNRFGLANRIGSFRFSAVWLHNTH